MILIKGNHVKGKAAFEDPGKAWDFKMEKQLDGAKTRIYEKTTDVLGHKAPCDPRIIIVSWSY